MKTRRTRSPVGNDVLLFPFSARTGAHLPEGCRIPVLSENIYKRWLEDRVGGVDFYL